MHASQTCKSRNSMSPVAVAVLAALATAGPARAQQAPDAVVGLEEIIVTAQKREQSLQEIPIAVSVVTGSLLDSVGGVSTEALKRLVPTLNIRKTNTSLNQALFLRGVGTINFAIAAQPSVAFVLDGVVMSSAGEAFAELYDVSRIEVLAGPQGTLYGKNASAGVVSVVSTMPGDELEGYVDLGYFQDGETRVKAAIDVPISDKLRTRTTAFWGEFDGYIDNISTTKAGGDTNGYDRWGVRSIWVADPTDNLQLTFIGDYRKSDDNCCAEIIGNAPTGAQAAALNNLWSGVDFKGVNTREIKQNQEMKATDEAWGLSLQADWGIGEYTLTSITAYRTWDATEYREGDWKDVPAAYVGNAFAQQHDYGPQTLDTFSQELRIASPGGEFVDYVAGLYYATTSAERLLPARRRRLHREHARGGRDGPAALHGGGLDHRLSVSQCRLRRGPRHVCRVRRRNVQPHRPLAPDRWRALDAGRPELLPQLQLLADRGTGHCARHRLGGPRALRRD